MVEKSISMTDTRHKFSIKNKFARILWIIACTIFFKNLKPRFFRKWRILLLKIFGANVSWKSTIHSSVKIWAPWNLEVGEYSCIGPLVDCYNQGKVVIGKNATISQKAYLCASSHDFTKTSHDLILKPITVRDKAWVAAGAFLGPGVTIGEGVVVGARSAVFKDVLAWSVVGGNPAMFIKKRVIDDL